MNAATNSLKYSGFFSLWNDILILLQEIWYIWIWQEITKMSTPNKPDLNKNKKTIRPKQDSLNWKPPSKMKYYKLVNLGSYFSLVFQSVLSINISRSVNPPLLAPFFFFVT